MSHLQRHHKFWPRKYYHSALEKRFRNLPCNIEHLTSEAHKTIHGEHPHGNPGGKPSREAMLRAVINHIEGRCSCPIPTTSPSRP